MSRVKHSTTFTIAQPVDIMFPLFSAEGETLWVPGWKYRNIMGSTDLHEDYVFVTPSHDHASTDAVWIVKRYEPNTHFVQFYRVEPDDKVGIVTVSCAAIGKHSTEVEVTYEYIGLSPKGNAFIDHFSSEKYQTFINGWETHLNHYFETIS